MDCAAQWRELTGPVATLVHIVQAATVKGQIGPLTHVQALSIAGLVDSIARECKRTHRRDLNLVNLCYESASLLLSIVDVNAEAAAAIRLKYSALVRRLLSVVLGLCAKCSRSRESPSDGAHLNGSIPGEPSSQCHCASQETVTVALSVMHRVIGCDGPVSVFDEGSPTIRQSINKLSSETIQSQNDGVKRIIERIKSLPSPPTKRIPTQSRSKINSDTKVNVNMTIPPHPASSNQHNDKSLLALLGLTSHPLTSSTSQPIPSPVTSSRSRGKTSKPLIHHDSSQSSSGASSPHAAPSVPINPLSQNQTAWLPRYSPQHPPHLTNVPTFISNPYMDRLSQSAPITHYLVQTATSSRQSLSSSRDELSLSQSPFSSPDDGELQRLNDDTQTVFHFEHFETPVQFAVESKQDQTIVVDESKHEQPIDEYMDFSPLLPLVHSPLHARLSSPERRSKYSTLTAEEASSMIEARHAKAAALRDASMVRTVEKLRSNTIHLNLDKRTKAESLIQQQRKEKLDDRLHTAAANHEEILEAKRRRAESENVKVAEVMFIKALEAARAEDRKLAIDRKLSETERRRDAAKAAKAQSATEFLKKQEQIKAKQRASSDHAQVMKAKIDDKLHAAEQRRVQARSASHSHKSSLSLLPQPKSANSVDEDRTPIYSTPRKSQSRMIIRPASSPAKPPSSVARNLFGDNNVSIFSIDQLRLLTVPSADDLLTPNTDNGSDLALTPEKPVPYFCQTCSEILHNSAAVTAHIESSDCIDSSIVIYDSKSHGRSIALALSKSSRRNQKKKAHKLKLKLSRSQTGTETVSVVADLEALKCDDAVRMSLIYKPVLSVLSHLAEIESAHSQDVSNALMTSAEWLATLLVRTQTLSKAVSQSDGDLPVAALGRIFRCIVGWSLMLPLPSDALTALARLALDCLTSVNQTSRILVLSEGACAVPALVGLVTGTLTQAIVTANVQIGVRQPLLDARVSPHLPVIVQLLSVCIDVSNITTNTSTDSKDWLNLAAVYGMMHRIAQLFIASQPWMTAALDVDVQTRFERDHEQLALSLIDLLSRIMRARELSCATQLALQATGCAGIFQLIVTLLHSHSTRTRTDEAPPVIHLLLQSGLVIIYECMKRTERVGLLMKQQFTALKTILKLVCFIPSSLPNEIEMVSTIIDRLCECTNDVMNSPVLFEDVIVMLDDSMVERIMRLGPLRQHIHIAIERYQSINQSIKSDDM